MQALLAATGEAGAFTFETGSMSALHPGRSARVLRRGVPVGWLGELHPTLTKSMDFTYPPVLFELDVSALAVQRSGLPGDLTLSAGAARPRGGG